MLSTDLIHHYRQLSQQPLTVVDVETTGRFASDSRVTEISVLQATLADGMQRQQTDLVNSKTIVPAKITEITGITQLMVDQAAIAAEVFPDYLPLLNTGVLTAHNLDFDYPFLQAEFRRIGASFSRPETAKLCTVKFSRLMLPDLPSRSLPDLVKHFRFEVGRSHRAEADTLACWLLAQRLFHEICTESDEVLIERFGRQWLSLKDAAALLGCSQAQAKIKLAVAPSRFVGRGSSGTLMYRRHDVEEVFFEEQGGTQISLL